MPFSFSQLSTYRTCPRQYEFANVKKIPRSISAGESFGSSVHNTLSRWGKLELQNGKPTVEKDQLALFIENEKEEDMSPLLTVDTLIDLWHQSFIVEGYANKIDADSARVRGEKIMHHFFAWWSHYPREVVAIEQGFSVSLQSDTEQSIRGRFDRIEQHTEGLHIIDFKTGSLRSQEETDVDLQLSMYAIAAEQIFAASCTQLTLLFLHEEGVKEVHTTRSDEQKALASRHIHVLAEGIEKADFTPTPSPQVCMRCPYRGICNAAMLS